MLLLRNFRDDDDKDPLLDEDPEEDPEDELESEPS